jgi:hypothetical protein
MFLTESLLDLTIGEKILGLLNAQVCLWPQQNTSSVFQYQQLKISYCKSDVQIDLPRYITKINQSYLAATVDIQMILRCV